LERVFTDLQDAPAIKALALFGMEDQFLADSGLSKKEIDEGRRTFQRALRGVYEGKISDEAFFGALPGFEEDEIRPASTNAGEVADDDLRETILKLKVMADNANIPNEPFQIDISDEVKKLVDQVLAGK
jgi:hypothetical protein